MRLRSWWTSGRIAVRASPSLIIAGLVGRTARARGTRVMLHPQFAHPFMDRDPAMRAERLALVDDFLE
jgi:hypothetical protein